MMDLYRTHTLGSSEVMDLGRGVHWLRQAADKGAKNAMYRLGLAYLDGYGVQMDRAQAKEWLQRAVVAGNPRAAFTIEQMDAGS